MVCQIFHYYHSPFIFRPIINYCIKGISLIRLQLTSFLTTLDNVKMDNHKIPQLSKDFFKQFTIKKEFQGFFQSVISAGYRIDAQGQT